MNKGYELAIDKNGKHKSAINTDNSSILVIIKQKLKITFRCHFKLSSWLSLV